MTRKNIEFYDWIPVIDEARGDQDFSEFVRNAVAEKIGVDKLPPPRRPGRPKVETLILAALWSVCKLSNKKIAKLLSVNDPEHITLMATGRKEITNEQSEKIIELGIKEGVAERVRGRVRLSK